jgi:hypothetical protein
MRTLYGIIVLSTSIISGLLIWFWWDHGAANLEATITEHPLTPLGATAGVALANILTIVQGLTGLLEHYPAFLLIGTAGMVWAAVSLLLTVIGTAVMHRTPRLGRGLIGCGIVSSISCVGLYVSAEAAGSVGWYLGVLQPKS